MRFACEIWCVADILSVSPSNKLSYHNLVPPLGIYMYVSRLTGPKPRLCSKLGRAFLTKIININLIEKLSSNIHVHCVQSYIM